MTLVLTWLTPNGIVMAGDSALTVTRPDGRRYVKEGAARKVFWCERLRVGLSAWGAWDIAGELLHEWLPSYLSKDLSGSVRELAASLAGELARAHGSNPTNKARVGIHVAGFEPVEGRAYPIFFHVHDGPTEAGWSSPPCPRRDDFEAVLDVSPELAKAMFQRGDVPGFRNGDYERFAELQEGLGVLLASYRAQGIIIPHAPDLDRYGEFVLIQLRLISDLYRLSNLLPGIGGRIDCLLFDPSGRVEFAERYR